MASLLQEIRCVVLCKVPGKRTFFVLTLIAYAVHSNRLIHPLEGSLGLQYFSCASQSSVEPLWVNQRRDE